MSEGTIELKRTIGAALESPQEADVAGTVLDPKGGRITFPFPLINWRGRNLLKVGDEAFDPELYYDKIPENRAPRCLAKYVDITALPSYHKFGTVYLNRIQSATNRLIEAIENYKMDNHADLSQARKYLQRAFSIFEDTIIHAIGGKSGLLSKNVAGMRINWSMMTPAAGTHQCDHDQILIPENIAKKLRAGENDMMMVHREPLLWSRGISFLRARIVPVYEADSVRLPWAVFQGMNADCDGDLVFICNLEQHLAGTEPDVRSQIDNEIEKAREVDAKLHEYSASLCLLKDEKAPEFDGGSCVKDLSERVDPSFGLSFGVEDVFGEDSFLDLLEHHLEIDKERILKYAKDLSEQEWTEEVFKTAKALCYTKRGLGLVGAIGSFCLVLGTSYPEAMAGAVAIKEGLSQTVLDAKHGEDLDHITECLDALMKAGKHEDSNPQQRLDALVQNGFKREQMAPLMSILGDEGIVTRVYKDYPGFLLCTTDSNTPSLLERFTNGEPDKSGPGADVGSWWDRKIRVKEQNA